MFDLTSTQQCIQELYFPETVGAPLRLELEFSRETAEPIEVLVIGERLSTVTIDQNGKVLKHGKFCTEKLLIKFPTLKFKYIESFSANSFQLSMKQETTFKW